MDNSIETDQNLRTNSNHEIRFRCPCCEKLYQTGSDVFSESNPEFDCQSCSKTFFLLKSLNSFGMYETKTTASNFKNCPKCTHLMPEAAKDCPSCGVYIEKYQEMVQAESPLLFELNQLWVKVVENFTDDQRHQNFLNLCQQRMALNFAFQKYDEVRKIVNYDESCEKYLKQIELRLQQQFLAKQTSGELPNQKTAQESKTFQWIFAIIGFVGLGLLIFNKIRPTFPNLTGLVVSITVLSFGLWILSSQNAVRGKNIKL